MIALVAALASAYDGYYQKPDIHGDQIVFSAESDLWLVPATGGTARRLTSGPGDERSAHFSPDGTWIAFTGEYDGNTDVYAVPVSGGEPVRLTWHPGPDDCIGFTPDGKVIFRSTRSDPNRVWRLFTVPTSGGDATELPLGWASRIDIDPSSGQYAFTRLGREAATWKRYRGGSADDIWVGDPKKADYHVVTSFEGPDSFPMWHGGRIYFLSDIGGTANLWSMNPDGSDRKAVTALAEGWDARWPSMGPDGSIVFNVGADVWKVDASGTAAKVPIDIPGERAFARERVEDVGGNLDWFAIGPDGDRVVISARGELFSVPSEPGVTIPITSGSGARERGAVYSNDGKRVAYITDASGEEAIVTADAWGRGEITTVLPPGKLGWHFPPTWSPDGKRLAYSDETQTLYVVNADGKSVPTAVDQSNMAEITSHEWSPDGRYLAYSKADLRGFATVWVYDTVTGEKHQVGGNNVENYDPAWDPDGRYLYFLSARHTNPYIGARDFDEVLLPEAIPFAVMLKKDTPNPFADNKGLPPATPADPAPQAAGEKSKKEKKKKDKKEDEKLLDPTEMPLPQVVIDWDGIDGRIVEFPMDHGFYVALQATRDAVFTMRVQPTGLNEPDELPPGHTLVSFDLNAKTASEFATNVYAFDIAPKAGKIAIYKGPWELYVVPTAGAGDWSKAQLALGDAQIDLDPREEWRQIYFEAWRNERDFFWDPGLSGLDWTGIRDHYASLLPRLASRSDLNDVLGEMIGELGTSHTYVGGGDLRPYAIPWQGGGLLGAETVREGNAFRIARILHGDAADNQASPLLEPGAAIREGEFILAVDRVPVRADVPLDAMLIGKSHRRVLLTVGPSADGKGSRDVLVSPLGDDGMLRYVDWVRQNREYVDKKTNGRVAYIHVPDMGNAGMTAFETWLYPQSMKDALIVDVRWNRGGYVSQLLLDKLRRPTDAFTVWRGGYQPYPWAKRRGPFVVLTNNFAGSDGDIFPRAVQIEGLAPVLGERSWGGVVGIRGDKPLQDGGFLSQPEYAFWFRQGGWGVENHGVDPDLVVGWTPQDVAAGHDTQLDTSIAEVLKLLEANPPLPAPTDRTSDKSRKAYEKER